MLYIYIDRYILGTKRCGVVKVKLELSSFHSGREKVCATGWHCTIYKPRSQIGHILEDFWPCLLEFLLRIKCWTCLQEKKKKREKRFPWRPSVLPLLRWMKKRKPFFLLQLQRNLKVQEVCLNIFHCFSEVPLSGTPQSTGDLDRILRRFCHWGRWAAPEN